MIPRVIRFWLRAEAIQMTFTIGTIFGMVVEAILITVPKILFHVLAATHHVI